MSALSIARSLVESTGWYVGWLGARLLFLLDVSIVGCQQFLYIESIGPYVLHQVNAVISIDICDLLIEGQAQFLIDSHSWHPFPNMLK